VRFLTWHGIAVITVAAVLSGCSGGEAQEQVFAAADATRIANVRPVSPGWTWPQIPDNPTPKEKLATKTPASDPLNVELGKKTAQFDQSDHVEAEADNRWQDENKLAELNVTVWTTASGAQKFMAPLNAFSRGWGKRTGRILKDEEVDDLGDDGWLLLVESNGRQVTYHWRRGNLMVEAFVHCFGSCSGDVQAATRAWADAIDQEARTTAP
jgi:hypothetical protein